MVLEAPNNVSVGVAQIGRLVYNGIYLLKTRIKKQRMETARSRPKAALFFTRVIFWLCLKSSCITWFERRPYRYFDSLPRIFCDHETPRSTTSPC